MIRAALIVALALALAGCGSTVKTMSHTERVPACTGKAGIAACVTDLARMKQRLSGLPADGIPLAKCGPRGAYWVCHVVVPDESGNKQCLALAVRLTPRMHFPMLVEWAYDYAGCGTA